MPQITKMFKVLEMGMLLKVPSPEIPSTPELARRVEGTGALIVAGSTEDFARHLKQEFALWKRSVGNDDCVGGLTQCFSFCRHIDLG